MYSSSSVGRWPLLTLRLVVLVMATAGLFSVLTYARRELAQRLAFEHGMVYTAVKPPVGPPPLTQESVDLALQLYGIEVPASAESPVFDMNMHDRGLTTRSAFMDKAKVSVGPAAFTSWALLGSTLAHEIEIHCNQNFLAIYLMDVIGLDGTGAAERQAYIHELHSAKRFGTDPEDTRMIADTVAYYYPEDPTGRAALVPKPVRSWLARAMLSSSLRRPPFR